MWLGGWGICTKSATARQSTSHHHDHEKPNFQFPHHSKHLFSCARFRGDRLKRRHCSEFAVMDSKPITLYTAATPNGFKASITLEELGVPYEVRSVDLSKEEQKEAWFLEISPNGKIPAIAEQYGEGNLMPELISREPKERSEVLSWLMFHLSDMGPTQGQAAYYIRTEEKNLLAQRRFLEETKQMYSVLDKALKGKKYLAGGRFSLADIAHFCWVAFHFHVGISLDDFPNIKGWVYRIYSREAVRRGLNVPTEFKYKELFQDAPTMKKWVEASRKRIVD